MTDKATTKPGLPIAGFQLIDERRLDEIDSTGRVYFHLQSGARLIHIANRDDHRVFCIGFRTPPPDDTGVAHILEHSVLCGSRRFPVKEPFVELAKGSLRTFLNALTYPDKTIYPVASKNARDFRNLMDVYLDAAFHPNIYNQPQILMQEGWHYEMENESDDISYKGVVYNEMKGALSVPESVLFRKIQESLFPGHVYGRESGGDPEDIPQLTQEQFEAFHRKYYHPSNSYIFLYGCERIEEELAFLDREYLSGFKRMEMESAIPLKAAFPQPVELEAQYPISQNEPLQDKCYLSLNFCTGVSTDPEVYLALDILEHLLLETQAAPLRRRLLDANLGKDVFGSFENGIRQPILSVVVKNSNPEEKERFEKIVFDTLAELADKGLDKKMVEASLNAKEFALREADFRGYPKGLVYCVRVLDAWLYDADPFLHLQWTPVLQKIKTALTSDYFERMIRTYLLSNSHRSLVLARPLPGLAEQAAEKTRQQLRALKAKFTDAQINGLIMSARALRQRQSEPDTEQALASIPLLKMSDIPKEVEKLPLERDDSRGFALLRHPQFADHILYLNLYFDTRGVPQHLLPYVPLLAGLMGRLGTAKYSDAELSNELNIHTGGLSFAHPVFEENKDDPRYFPKFMIRSKVLPGKTAKLIELLAEILIRSRLDEAPRIKEILQETRSRLEMSILSEGHSFARRRLLSYFSEAGAYAEQVSGLSFYQFIRDLEVNFEKKLPQIVAHLQATARVILSRSNLLASITGENADIQRACDGLEPFVSQLDKGVAGAERYQFDLAPRNEGLLTPGKVQYVAKGFNFHQLGFPYRHSLAVLQTILGLDYLWNRVRVQNGAYGAFASFARGGNVVFSSYRDPSLAETLSVFDGAGKYLRDFNPPQREMTKYIIGTIGKIDFPLTPSVKGEHAAENYIRGITQEDLQAQKDEVLRTTSEDMRRFSEMLDCVMAKKCHCVVGGEGKLKANAGLFGTLVPVFAE